MMSSWVVEPPRAPVRRRTMNPRSIIAAGNRSVPRGWPMLDG